MGKSFLNKVKRKWKKLRLQPIHVYCVHHVSEQFDPNSMWESDWMSMALFKDKVMHLQRNGVQFISLAEAQSHMRKDIFRFRKYAVLTFDDGFASLKEILPWLDEQKIPCTLFLNGKYLDGKSYRMSAQEHYLTSEDIYTLSTKYPGVTIGSHGWEHIDALTMSIDEFKQSVEQNNGLLHAHPRYIPYHAYTWGHHTKETDGYLWSREIIPVYADGVKNYNESKIIHRELL